MISEFSEVEQSIRGVPGNLPVRFVCLEAARQYFELAGIDWRGPGDQFDKAGADLRAGGCERGEDLESLSTGSGLVATGGCLKR